MNKVLITGFRAYNFKNDSTGELVQGVRISFLTSEKAKGQNECGYLPMQSSLNLESAKDLKEVPGIYNAKYEMVPGKGNKPTLALTGFEFIKPVSLEGLFNADK